MIQALGNRVRSVRTLGQRFWRQPSGATAVEFGLIAVPFFFLKMAIIETALVFWASQLLESGVAEAGRQIRTGQVQEAGIGAEDFRQMVCQSAGVLFDCGDRLQVDVQRSVTFDAADLSAPPVDAAGEFSGAFGFQPGGPSETVIVRAFYRWPLLFNFFGLDASDIAGQQRLLVATTAFRNEPF
ncbi:MAG: pilus assembly protein [Devosiaceae bacterium]|nr:pilus assembly protein [Devosiaceae bacterium MH13]